MRKNVAGQVVTAQMNSRVDGSPLTSAVSVYVLVDGGTLTVGGGTLTHEGDGLWSYVPTAAETNGNHVAFQFRHASGVYTDRQVWPTSLDPTDTTAAGIGRLDATVSSRASQTTADAIETDTQDIQTRLPAALVGGRIDANIGAVTAAAITNAAFAAGAFDATALATDAVNEIADGVLDELMAGHTVPGSLAAAVSDILTDTGTTLDANITAIKAVTDLLPDGGALNDLATLEARLTAVRAALLDALADLENLPVPGQAASGTQTTTVITTNLSGYDVNGLAGRVFTVKRGATTAPGASGIIASNTAGGAQITLEATTPLPAAMTVGDDFVIS